MTDGKKIKIIRILLIVLISISVLSCFIQSLMPPEVSERESDTVADVIAEVIPPDTAVGEFTETNIRKIGHFFEYGIIGLELAIYGALFITGKLRTALISLAFAHSVAFVDESLQIISGRGPAIADVWLDTIGFCVFYLLTVGIILVCSRIKSKIKNKET